jgi:coenzyme F420-0:L-glutamate ligase / coenzyme F420-1:gamma-L-glutamate ligase
LLSPAESAFVRRQRVARLATVSEHGLPHAVPVCYAYGGTQFYFALDEKEKRVPDTRLRRIRNIVANPSVALLIDRYDDDWSQLCYVLIRGASRLVTPGEEGHDVALTLLRERYPQYRTMDLEHRMVIVIIPERVTSWRVE